MKTSRSDHFFIYPKTIRGKRTGHTICVLLKDGLMFEGTALCSAEDLFSKKEGRKIAYQKALDIYSRITGTDIYGQNIYDVVETKS